MYANFRRRLLVAGITAVVTLPVFANTSERSLRIDHFERLQTQEHLSVDVSERSGSDKYQTLQFHAYGRDYQLRLEPNTRLSAAATISSIGLFRGVVAGAADSWARISVTSGATRGMFWDGRDLYLVDSARILDDARASGLAASDTVIFRLSDALDSRSESSGKAQFSGGAVYRTALDRMSQVDASRMSAGYRLDISALGDAAFRARFSSDAEAQEEILTRLNNVDGIFSSQLGVEIQVSSVTAGAAATPGVSDVTDASALLRQLGGLRLQQSGLSGEAITFLFTGRELDGDKVGLAYTRTLCSPQFSAGLAQASVNSGLDSLIAAHEIAHILGAPHDGEKQCAGVPKSHFLMTPALISSESVFSSCSIASMRPQIQRGSCVVALDDSHQAVDRRLAVAESDLTDPAAVVLTPASAQANQFPDRE